MPGFVVTPTLQSVYAALVPFIVTVTGLAASQVVQGLPNRAAMPVPGFISLQTLMRKRLRTNLHDYPSGGNPTTVTFEEGVELTVQIDCYGPQSTAEVEGAEDWATILSTTLRDEYGYTQLAPTVAPLYADEARLIPLVAGESQYEERWSLDAHFQVNAQTTLAQQYADLLKISVVSVEQAYPR